MTPLQMARFYALIANGGKLVTPHVLMDVENPNETAVPIAALAGAAARVGVDPAALQVVRAGPLRGHAPQLRHLLRRLRQLPGLDRGQDGHGREGRHAAAAYTRTPEPVVVVRLRADRQRRSIVVCAVIENGGHGGDRCGARPPPRSSRSSSTSRSTRRPDPLATDDGQHSALMLEYAGSQRAGSQRRRAARRSRSSPSLRSLDWLLAGRRRGARRRRPLGDRRRHAARRRRATRTTTSTARSSSPPSAASRCIAALRRSTRTSTAATGARSSSAPSALIAIVLRRSARAARGSTRWIDVGFFTLPAVGVREAAVRPRRSPASSPSARAASNDVRTTLRSARARRDADRARLRRSRTSARRSSTSPRSARCCSSAGRRWKHLAALGALGVLVAVGVLWARPGGRRPLPQGLPEVSASPASRIPTTCPVDARYNVEQSIAAVGSGEFNGRGVDERDADAPRLPARARTPTSSSRRSASSAASSARRSCSRSTCSCSGGACASSRSRATLLGDRRRRDRRRAPLPDLRQRRHDDGDRADHRHPAAVRQRRRLVDDREPRGDGRAARDPRARPRPRARAP